MLIYKGLYFTSNEFEYLCNKYSKELIDECVEILAEDLKQGKIKKFIFRESRKYMHINKLQKLLLKKNLEKLNNTRKKLKMKPFQL